MSVRRNPVGDRHFDPEGRMENQGGRGLPEKLPDGERVLWQGSPSWRTLFRRMFHARGVAVYFALLLVWCVASWARAGLPAHAIALSTLRLAGLALVPIVLMALYAWGIQRTTIYTITNRRVVLGIGLAVPMTLNLPFSRIASAGLRAYPDGAGDIPLQLLPHEKIGYLVLWPHARPWRMARTEPMLRGLAQAEPVAAILGRALSAHAGLPHAELAVRVPAPVRAADRLAGQTAAA